MITEKIKFYLNVAAGVLIVGLIGTVFVLSSSLKTARNDRDGYQQTVETILSECKTWKTKDSLSVAKNGLLNLKISELERYRKEDLETIKSLKKRNEDLKNMILQQSETNVVVKTEVRDSIVYVDSSKFNIRYFTWADPWVSVQGHLNDDLVSMEVSNKDSLVVGVTTEYKRFLGFLWKTSKVKTQHVYAVSKNPHTTIKNIEYINVQ